jgi:Zn-dependent protease
LSFLAYPLDVLPFVVLVLMISFTFHEFSHAFAAYKFGDPTAKQFGRVTLNPMAHIDIVGTLFLLVAGFGWAKPVPVNRSRFKNPRLMGVIVSLAGPVSNLALAFVGVIVIYLLLHFRWLENSSFGVISAVSEFLKYFIQINMILFIFNLIPIPPLDGYRIIHDIFPARAAAGFGKYEQWAFYIFLLLIFIPPLYSVTLGPIFNLRYPILDFLSIPLKWIFPIDVNWRLFV